MAIQSSKPAIVPAVPSKTFDKWWLRTLMIDASDLNGAVPVTIVWERYCRDAKGAGEAMAGSERRADIGDVFALATKSQKVAQALQLLLDAAEEHSRAEGIID